MAGDRRTAGSLGAEDLAGADRDPGRRTPGGSMDPAGPARRACQWAHGRNAGRGQVGLAPVWSLRPPKQERPARGEETRFRTDPVVACAEMSVMVRRLRRATLRAIVIALPLVTAVLVVPASNAGAATLVRPNALAPGPLPAGLHSLGALPGRHFLSLDVVLTPG